MTEPSGLVEPLDLWILDLLPKEGAMVLGAYPDGILVSKIKSQIANGQLKSDLISSRLRVMKTMGLTVNMPGVGTSGKDVWQRTTKGEAVLTERKRRASDG